MDAQFDFFLMIFNVAIILLIAGFLVSVIYKRATIGLAYVRSGYGGERVIQDTGVFVLPWFHRVIPINLNTIRLEIGITNESALLTKDYLKIDLWINFYVRVLAKEDDIARAAQTLGARTLDPGQLKAFLEGKLVNAIRLATAEMTMEEIHQHREQLIEKIKRAVSEDLLKNSLQLESIALDNIVQTARDFFYEDSLLDASALTKLTETIEKEEKHRHAIAQETRFEKKQKELEVEKQIIEMENKKIHLRLEQKRELKLFEAANALKIAKDAAVKHSEEEQARLITEQEIELAQQAKVNRINIQLNEQLKIQIAADRVRAEAAKVEEQVTTARELEIANRKNQIELSKEKLKNEHEIAMITAVAAAEKSAAIDYAESGRLKAKGEADKLRIITSGSIEVDQLLFDLGKNRYQNQAAGIKTMIEAFSNIGSSNLSLELHQDLLELLSEQINKENQLVNNIKTSVLNSEVYKANTRAFSADIKANNQQNPQFKIGKLQTMLEDAHNSLLAETVNTIMETDNDNGSEEIVRNS